MNLILGQEAEIVSGQRPGTTSDDRKRIADLGARSPRIAAGECSLDLDILSK